MDELTDEQREALRDSLHEIAASLKASMHDTIEASAPPELDQAAVGRVSRIDAIQQQQMVQAQRRRVEVRMRLVEAALAAFDEDEYGWCRRCGESIGYPRLKARPESPCCVPCTAEIERG